MMHHARGRIPDVFLTLEADGSLTDDDRLETLLGRRDSLSKLADQIAEENELNGITEWDYSDEPMRIPTPIPLHVIEKRRKANKAARKARKHNRRK